MDFPAQSHQTPAGSPAMGIGNPKSIPLGRGDGCAALGQSAWGQRGPASTALRGKPLLPLKQKTQKGEKIEVC